MGDGAEGATQLDVWVRHVEPPIDTSCLDDVELARLATLRDPAQRRSYAAGHVLARRALAEVLGVAPRDLRFDRTCAACGGQHGRPVVEGAPLHVGLTRTREVVAVVVSETGPVAIDVESIDGTDFPGFPDIALHPGERESVEAGDPGDPADRPRRRAVAWARKEAALKAAGVGLRVDPASLPTPPNGIRTRLDAVGVDVTVVDLPLEVPGVVGAVALLGPGGAVSVRWR